ncbi:hypothetical protein GIB67_008983, partial [Kingdonia uniflora]
MNFHVCFCDQYMLLFYQLRITKNLDWFEYILIDKIGTLKMNKMIFRRFYIDGVFHRNECW